MTPSISATKAKDKVTIGIQSDLRAQWVEENMTPSYARKVASMLEDAADIAENGDS